MERIQDQIFDASGIVEKVNAKRIDLAALD
jgi:hypothetical protein